MAGEIKIAKVDDLAEILSKANLGESAFCHSLCCEVVMHHSGYTLHGYDIEPDRFTGSIAFVPHIKTGMNL